jgi:hypothetical protein
MMVFVIIANMAVFSVKINLHAYNAKVGTIYHKVSAMFVLRDARVA